MEIKTDNRLVRFQYGDPYWHGFEYYNVVFYDTNCSDQEIQLLYGEVVKEIGFDFLDSFSGWGNNEITYEQLNSILNYIGESNSIDSDAELDSLSRVTPLQFKHFFLRLIQTAIANSLRADTKYFQVHELNFTNLSKILRLSTKVGYGLYD
jgi:hypothetical protein